MYPRIAVTHGPCRWEILSWQKKRSETRFLKKRLISFYLTLIFFFSQKEPERLKTQNTSRTVIVKYLNFSVHHKLSNTNAT